MSSMRSTSSMARISTPLISSLPRSKWSRKAAEGADQNICAALGLAILIFKKRPPMRRATLRRWFLPWLSKFLASWAASSRVSSGDQRAGTAGAGAALFRSDSIRREQGCRLAVAGLGDAADIRRSSAKGIAPSEWE